MGRKFRNSETGCLPLPESCAHNLAQMANLKFRRWHQLCMLAALTFYLAFIWRGSFVWMGQRFFSLFDDAMISMRYAKNLADGFGLRWNPGETPVEGYTNFLWTIVMAGLHLLPIPISKICLAVMVVGVFILMANLQVVKKITEHLTGEDSAAPLVAVFLSAFYYPLIYWTLRGMEVGFLCLLLNLAILCAFRLHDKYALKDVIGIAFALSAAVLTRPDMVVPVIFLGLFLVYVIWKSGFKASYLIIPLAIGVALGGLTLFRIKYYGDPVPNTYYLKVTGVTLFERVSRGVKVFLELAAYHLWPVLLLLTVGFAKNFRRFAHPKMVLLLALFLGQAVYSVYVGGDAWEWMNYSNRYLAMTLPSLFVALSVVVCRPEPLEIRRVLATLPFLGIGLWLHSIYFLAGKPDKFAAVGLMGVGLLLAIFGAGAVLSHRRRPLTPIFSAILATLAIAAALNFFGVANWLWKKNNGGMIYEDAVCVRAGLLLKQATAPDTRIAYVRAGIIPYFAGREAIDLLGKSDPVIAKGKPAAAFYPGHNKWNYAYSIGQLKPDLVWDLWKPTDAEKKMIEGFGYVGHPCIFGNTQYLRNGSSNKVDLATLTAKPQLTAPDSHF